jgi:hypothetical protein
MNAELVAIRRQSSADGKRYEHNQSLPVTDWIVAHNLNAIAPSVTVINSAGKQVLGSVTFLDFNNLRVHFSAPFSGKAYVVA